MVRIIITACLLACVIGCGAEAEPCTVTEEAGGAVITCPDGTSATVNDGEDGSRGADGADGLRGADGQDGNDNHITGTLTCAGLLEGAPFAFTYSAAVTSAGDVFAQGSVTDGAGQHGGSAFYSANQAGAATASVIFTWDAWGAPNAGWWHIGVNRATLVTVIVYTDSEMPAGQETWTMQPSACIINTFP